MHRLCNCIESQGLHRVEVDLDICSKAFGFTPAQVTYQIQHALAIYGGANIQVTDLLKLSLDCVIVVC